MEETAKKKGRAKTVLFILAAIAAAVLGVITYLNSRYPVLTKEDVTAAVRSAYEEDLALIREEHDLPNLTIELEFESFTFTRPTIFKKGYLNAKVKDYYVYPALDDTGEYSEELYQQILTVLYDIKSFCEYGNFNKVELEDYSSVYVSRVPGHFPELRDTQGNAYNAYTTLYENIIEINGRPAFSIETGYEGPDLYTGNDSSDNGGASKKCVKCGAVVTHLASNGHCKTCVDVYDTDYYIGLDGEVHAAW